VGALLWKLGVEGMRLKISISVRLFIGFGIICLFLLGIGMFSMITMSNVNKTTTEITDNWMPSVSKAYQMKLAVTQFNQLEGKFITASESGSASEGQAIEEQMIQLNETLNQLVEEYLAATNNEEAKKIANTFYMEFDAYQLTHDQIIDSAKSGSISGAKLLYEGNGDRFFNNIHQHLDNLIILSEQLAGEAADTNQTQYDRGQLIILIAMASIVVISVLISLFTSRSIVKPIRRINTVLGDLADAKGDLSRRVEVKSGDEIEIMGNNVNKVLETVEHMVTQIHSSTEEVATYSSQIESSCKQLEGSSDEISLAITNLSQRAVEQLEKTSSTQQFMDEYYELLKQVSAYAEQTYHIAQNANEKSEEGNTQIQNVLQQMDQIKSQNKITSKSMEYFQNSLEKVENINTMIQNISRQTNLLSLNAGIEAARAGEHGKGFAVVAQEVRKLSIQTSDASQSIVTLLDEIQNEVRKVTADFGQNTKSIELGSEHIGKMLDTFGMIRDTNNKVMVNGQKTTEETHRILETVQEIMDTFKFIGEMSQDQSAASEEISASAQEQLYNTKNISNLMNSLSEQASRLKSLVDQFNVKA
jgi:methyl-accepting chemotaxis protein